MVELVRSRKLRFKIRENENIIDKMRFKLISRKIRRRSNRKKWKK